MNDFNQLLLTALIQEKEHEIRSGVYGFTQREFAYNSNKIEGSKLSKDQTASLFSTGTIYADGIYRAKDIEETSGHFALFNFMLKTLEDNLSEELIKNFHKILKQGVFEDIANGYAIGDYKTRANVVNDIQTILPKDVPAAMRKLLERYGNSNKTLDDLAEFHALYEAIHPFQDGNGRTGRMLLFRECLNNNLTPFIVRDSNKLQYITAINKAQKMGIFEDLILYFKGEQNWYKKTVEGLIDSTKANNENTNSKALPIFSFLE